MACKICPICGNKRHFSEIDKKSGICVYCLGMDKKKNSKNPRAIPLKERT